MELLKSYTTHGCIKLSNMCYQSLPCKHHVEYKGQFFGHMSSLKICDLFEKEGIPIPDHFTHALKIRNLRRALNQIKCGPLNYLEADPILIAHPLRAVQQAIMSKRFDLVKCFIHKVKLSGYDIDIDQPPDIIDLQLSALTPERLRSAGLCHKAVQCNNLQALDHLIKKWKVECHVRVICGKGTSAPIVDYVIKHAVEQKQVVINADTIISFINLKLYDRLVSAGIIRSIDRKYNIKVSYKGQTQDGIRVLTDNNDSLELFFESRALRGMFKQLCFTTFTKDSIFIPMYKPHLAIKSMDIKAVLEDGSIVDKCEMYSNYESRLFELKHCKKVFIKPLLLKYIHFCCMNLKFTTDSKRTPIAVKRLDVAIELVDPIANDMNQSYQIDGKIIHVRGGTIGVNTE